MNSSRKSLTCWCTTLRTGRGHINLENSVWLSLPRTRTIRTPTWNSVNCSTATDCRRSITKPRFLWTCSLSPRIRSFKDQIPFFPFNFYIFLKCERAFSHTLCICIRNNFITLFKRIIFCSFSRINDMEQFFFFFVIMYMELSLLFHTNQLIRTKICLHVDRLISDL